MQREIYHELPQLNRHARNPPLAGSGSGSLPLADTAGAAPLDGATVNAPSAGAGAAAAAGAGAGAALTGGLNRGRSLWWRDERPTAIRHSFRSCKQNRAQAHSERTTIITRDR